MFVAFLCWFVVVVLWLMSGDFVVSCCCGCLWCVWDLVWYGCVVGSAGIVGLLLLRCCLFNIV